MSLPSVGKNRMLGGVHHPTDIVAGQKLGDALTHRLFSSPEFLQKLDKLYKTTDTSFYP